MAIDFADKIRSLMVIPILDGRDADKIVLIDPDPTTPAYKLANKAVLRSETFMIEVYNESGILSKEVNINPEDLSEIIGNIEDLDSRADGFDNSISALTSATSANAQAAKDAHDRADAAHKVGSSAQTEAAANTTAIGHNTKKVTEHTGRIEGLELKQKDDRADIRSLEGAVAGVEGDVSDIESSISRIDGELEDLRAKDTSLDGDISTINTNIGNIDTKIEELEGVDSSLDGRITKVEEEINSVPGSGGILRQYTDIEIKNLSSSTGKFEFDENFFLPDTDPQTVNDNPKQFSFTFKNENGDTEGFLITKNTVDTKGKPIIITQSENENAAVTNSQLNTVISTQARIDSDLSGVKGDVTNLKPRVNQLENDTQVGLPAMINEVEAKIPDVSNFIETDSDASLTSVTFGNNTKIDHQDELGLVLQGETIYGKTQEGIELFFVDKNNFDVKNKKIQNVIDGIADDDASTVRQLNIVSLVANGAEAATEINAAAIASNKTVADRADSLSQENKNTLDNLPSLPSLEDYAKLGDDVNFGNIAVTGNITGLQSGADVDTNAANIGDVKSRINAINLPPDLTDKVNEIETTANAADTLSQTNKTTLENALLKDEYGWDVNNLNIYNVSRLSRTNNAVNSSGLSIGDADVNLHGDTVGITNGNSATTYAVFSAGGLNVNDRPITRVASGGDIDTNVANIGDVKRLAQGADLSEYAKLDDTVQFARVNIKNDFANDTKEPYFWCDPNNGNTVIGATGSLYFNQYANDGTKTRWAIVDANSRMTLDNATKVQRLMNKDTWSTDSTNEHAGFIRWDLDKRIVVGAKQDVTFQVNGKDVYKVIENGIDFTGQGGNVAISHDHNIDVNVNGVTNVAFKDSGMKLLRDVDAHNQNINNMGDINFGSNYAILGKSNRNLAVLNAKGIFSQETASKNQMSVEFTESSVFITAPNTYIRTHNGGNIAQLTENGIDCKDNPITNAAEAATDADIPNLGQVKGLIDGLGAGLKFESYLAHDKTAGLNVFEAQGHPNCFVDFIAASGGAGINFDVSKQGQSVIVGVRNNSGGTGTCSVNISFQGNTDQNIGNAKVPVGYMFVGVFNADLGKSYSMIVPFKNVQHSYSALTDDIDLTNVAPKTLFLTGDQGILESYIENGETKLRAIEDYNIPKINDDVDELKEHRDLNLPTKHHFLSESIVSVPWNNPDKQPTTSLFIVDNNKIIADLGFTISDNFDGTYTGTYLTVGVFSITNSGLWKENAGRNIFKNVESNKYAVYNSDTLTWQLISSDVPLEHAVFADPQTIINLNQFTSVPGSSGDYTVNLDLEDIKKISSLDFINPLMSPSVDTVNKVVIYNFGTHKPSGYVLVE